MAVSKVYDTRALFYIKELVKKFFIDVWQTPNQLKVYARVKSIPLISSAT